MLKRLILAFFLLSFAYADVCAENNYGEIININYEYEIAFTDLSDAYLKVKDIVEIRKDGKFVAYLQVSQTSPAISRLIPVRDDSKYKTEIDFKKISVGSSVVAINSDKKNAMTKEIAAQDDVRKGLLTDNPTKDAASLISDSNQKNENIQLLNDKVNVLSDNYVRLSKSLSSLLEQKEQIENELLKNKDELKSLVLKNEELKSQNALLQEELKTCRSKIDEDKCSDLKKEVSSLKGKLDLLKSKLFNINKLIEK